MVPNPQSLNLPTQSAKNWKRSRAAMPPPSNSRCARIVLAAADGANNGQIARHLDVSVDMVRRWRERWLVLQPVALDELPVGERLTDAPRPGKPVRITAEQVSQIVALACDPPAASQRPISQWTSRELADEIQQRGIVDQISGRHAARLLKRGLSNRT